MSLSLKLDLLDLIHGREAQAKRLAASARELAESNKQKARCAMLEARACHALHSWRDAFRCYTDVRPQSCAVAGANAITEAAMTRS